MQPSAPDSEKVMMQPPTAPPSYNEAVGQQTGNIGWNVQQQQPQPGGGGMQPLHPAPSHTVPTHAPVMQMQVVNVIMVGPRPINTNCPNCRADVKTTTITTPRTMAHLGCLALCLTGFWFCCCLPYCFDACKRTEHSCPNCKAMIGVYNG